MVALRARHTAAGIMGEPRSTTMATLARFTPALDLLLEHINNTPVLAPSSEERSFPVYDGGCLRLAVPPRWHEEFEIGGERCSLVFRTADRSPLVLRIDTTVLTVQQSLGFSVEDMRNEVHAAARAANAGGIEVFAGRHGGGFHFSNIEPVSGRRLVHGRFLARPLLLDFRIDARSGGAARNALELVRSARAAPG
jgi:hypothetical protein